jgi:hypothetical protein
MSRSRTCRAVGGKIRDKDGGTREYTATVHVNNVAPTCGPIVAPVAVSVGTSVTATAPFTDPGTADTHTGVMAWGDGSTSAATVTETNGSGTATASHTYTAAGVYTLTLTVNFHSESYEWLVISGPRAQYKGSGQINGAGDYGFKLTAIDGDASGGGGVDRFRIKIWNKATGVVVYDNQVGAPDDATPSTALGGGSIVIHR